MAAPAAEEASEHESADQRHGEEDEAGVHVAELQRVHGLRGLDGGERAPGHQEVGHVECDQGVHPDQDPGPPLAARGLADDRLLRPQDGEAAIACRDFHVASAHGTDNSTAHAAPGGPPPEKA